MKVLFINNFRGIDYQNDSVYYGLIENGFDVFESNHPNYLMKGFTGWPWLYGKGFSYANKMTHTPKVESSEQIMDKISSKFYDIIVYGSIWRDDSFISHVTDIYDKFRIHFVDGEDELKMRDDLFSKGVYWKRELRDNIANPIHFGIPECQLITHNPIKEKLFAHIIPGDKSTYIFNDEESYYKDYEISYYGKTWKKAGWDCLRHYEILTNKCIPYFPDLESCPEMTMTTFPKKLVLQTNLYAEKNQIHPNYDEINQELFDYTKVNLTSKRLVQKMFLD